MAFHFVGGDRDQQFLLPMSMLDWVPDDHLVWFLIDVVDKIDTSAFAALHPNWGPGRPAYDPDMMLTVMFYAYTSGLVSSRRIEQLCRTDAAFRVICGSVTPDHATFARFRVNHEQAIEDTFVEVLRVCAAAGLVSVDVVAIDGTKMGSDASLNKNRTAEWIRGQVTEMLAAASSADDGDRSGGFFDGELPDGLSTSTGRLARLEAALAEVEAQDTAEREGVVAKEDKARAAADKGKKLRGRKPKDPQARLVRAEIEEQAARVAATNKGRADVDTDPGVVAAVEATGAARQHLEANPPKANRANTTDPESRVMSSVQGWVQGYNAQAAVNEHQIIVGISVTQEGNDSLQYGPMVQTAIESLKGAGVHTPIGTVLADAGYWSETNATIAGPDRLIATLKDHKQRAAARLLGTTTGEPPEDANTVDAMEHRLRTEQGAALYGQRSYTVEPVFGDTKENLGFRRFSRRGLKASRSEWALIANAHNLKKAFNHHQNLNVAVT